VPEDKEAEEAGVFVIEFSLNFSNLPKIGSERSMISDSRATFTTWSNSLPTLEIAILSVNPTKPT
jgi:hypothetical protein